MHKLLVGKVLQLGPKTEPDDGKFLFYFGGSHLEQAISPVAPEILPVFPAEEAMK